MMEELLQAYYEEFGDWFPMYQIARTRSEEQTIKIIKQCLESKKDAYELGYCVDDLDFIY